MKIAPPSATPPVATTLKTNTENELNPAKQAKAAETPAKGADFGHAVADIAHARNAARFEAKHGPKTPPPALPPVVEPPPVEETPPTDVAPPVDEPAPVEATPPVAETSDTPPAVDPAAAVETQLLAGLVANLDAEPGDTLDVVA